MRVRGYTYATRDTFTLASLEHDTQNTDSPTDTPSLTIAGQSAGEM